MTRRVGVTEALENCMKAAIFSGEDEAIEVLTGRDHRLKQVRAGDDRAGEACIEPEEGSKKRKPKRTTRAGSLSCFMTT